MVCDPYEWVCDRCGGTDIEIGAYAKWNVVTQDWELGSVMDHNDYDWCMTCQDTAMTETKPITDVKILAQVAIHKGEQK